MFRRKRKVRKIKQVRDPNKVYCSAVTCSRECDGKDYIDNSVIFKCSMNKIPYIHKRALLQTLINADSTYRTKFPSSPDIPNKTIVSLAQAAYTESVNKGLDPTKMGVTWSVTLDNGAYKIIDIQRKHAKRYCDLHTPHADIPVTQVINKLVRSHSMSVANFTRKQRCVQVDLQCNLLGCSYEEFLEYLLSHTKTNPPVTAHTYISGECTLTTKCSPLEYNLNSLEGQYAAFHFSNYMLMWGDPVVRSYIHAVADDGVSALYTTYTDYISMCPTSTIYECLSEGSSSSGTNLYKVSLIGDTSRVYLEGDTTPTESIESKKSERKKSRKSTESEHKKSRKSSEHEKSKERSEHKKSRKSSEHKKSRERSEHKKSRKSSEHEKSQERSERDSDHERRRERRKMREDLGKVTIPDQLVYTQASRPVAGLYPEISTKRTHRHSR